MAHKFAIFIHTWNKDDVMFFDDFAEAQKEWENICSKRNALKTDGGKNVVVANPRLPYLSYIYSKTSYQRSW